MLHSSGDCLNYFTSGIKNVGDFGRLLNWNIVAQMMNGNGIILRDKQRPMDSDVIRHT